MSVSLAIPALQPVVHDLFILRGANKADAGKELETQKEVVVSMLLRLIQYHQVIFVWAALYSHYSLRLLGLKILNSVFLKLFNVFFSSASL